MDYDTQLDEDSSAPAKLFVGQIPKDVTESTLSGYFDEFGTIKEVSIIRDSAGASRGKILFCKIYMNLVLTQYFSYRLCFCNFFQAKCSDTCSSKFA